MEMETIKWQTKAMYGYKPVSDGLGRGIGWMQSPTLMTALLRQHMWQLLHYIS